MEGKKISELITKSKESFQGGNLRGQIKKLFLTGLLILAPVALTAYIVVALFSFMDNIFSPLVRSTLGIHIPGLGLIMTLLTILLLGWLSTNVVGQKMLQGVEHLLGRIPVAKSIYWAAKGIVEALSKEQREAFKRVVLIEYPRRGVYSLAFVTNWAEWPNLGEKMADLLVVFVPTTPNPTSGFLLLVPHQEVIDLSIPVEEGIRMVLSGGILLPDPQDLKPPVIPKPTYVHEEFWPDRANERS